MLEINEIAQGNPGALNFAVQAYIRNPALAERSFQRMVDANIAGTKLYMLWSDCLQRNVEASLKVMNTWQIGKILGAINYDGGRGYEITEEDMLNNGARFSDPRYVDLDEEEANEADKG